MFGLSYKSVPAVRDYDEALRQYETSARLYGMSGADVAYLSRKRDPSKLVSLRGDDVVFTYHHTDCVTYHKGGDVTIKSYASQSTNTFVHCLSPHNITPDFCYGPGKMLWVSGKGYKIIRPTRLRYNADTKRLDFPEDQITPWETVKVDTRAVSRQLKAIGWDGFHDFLAAACATDELRRAFIAHVADDVEPLPLDHRDDAHNYQLVVGCLASQDYMPLAAAFYANRSFYEGEARTRIMITRVHQLAKPVYIPVFQSQAEANTFRRHDKIAYKFL